MKAEKRNAIHEEIHQKIIGIYNTKGKDYAGEEDVLANFKRGAKKNGLTKYQVLMVLKDKHEDAISDAVKRHAQDLGAKFPARRGESLEESIIDAINYNILLLCLLREDEEIDKTHNILK